MTSEAKPDYSKAVAAARQYYNLSDADIFYATIWGGEDKHIGVYDHPDEDIATASRRAVEVMASKVRLGPDVRVLDVGSGYGGVARHLARTFGCSVRCLNLSEVENERNRSRTETEGLTDLVDVVDGSFEDLPFENDEFDLVWSQDAFLHSGDPVRMLAEVLRVLRPGGELVFSDLLATEDADPASLGPILERLHLDTLSTASFYERELERLGAVDIDFEERTADLITHYRRILEETEHRWDELRSRISPEFAEPLRQSLQRWIDGGEAGNVTWGIFVVRT